MISLQPDLERVTKLDKVRQIFPDVEDLAASPTLVRDERELPEWLVKHKADCCCYACSHPIVAVFLVRFFTYQV